MTEVAIARAVMDENPGVVVEVSTEERSMRVDVVFVPKSMRRRGVGSEVMRRLCAHADEVGSRIVLEPRDELGTSKVVLVRWYSRFGFVPLDAVTMVRSARSNPSRP